MFYDTIQYTIVGYFFGLKFSSPIFPAVKKKKDHESYQHLPVGVPIKTLKNGELTPCNGTSSLRAKWFPEN